MLTVFSSSDPMDINFAKSILSSVGISPYEADVHTSNIEGSIGIFPKRLMVVEADYDAARQALMDNGLIDE